MLVCNVADRTREKRLGMLHRTKNKYVLRHFSCRLILLFHQSCIDSPDKNIISSQNVTVLKNRHSLKAVASITLMEGGMLMRRSTHPRNASSPISSSPSLRIAVVNPEQHLNALFLIALTEGGMSIRTSAHPRNASSPIPPAHR